MELGSWWGSNTPVRVGAGAERILVGRMSYVELGVWWGSNSGTGTQWGAGRCGRILRELMQRYGECNNAVRVYHTGVFGDTREVIATVGHVGPVGPLANKEEQNEGA